MFLTLTQMKINEDWISFLSAFLSTLLVPLSKSGNCIFLTYECAACIGKKLYGFLPQKLYSFPGLLADPQKFVWLEMLEKW